MEGQQILQPDWNKFKIRASSLFVLFVEPQSKAAKERGELSATAKKHLYKVYIEAKWGRRKEIAAKQLEKGKLVEEQLIETLSIIDGEKYIKNTVREENEWITGEADIVAKDWTDDAKASWDHESFAPFIMEDIPSENFYQGQGYMWLYKKELHKVSRILVSAPQSIIDAELKRLLFSMDVTGEESTEYKEAAAEMLKNLVYDDVPIEQRIIRKSFILDQSIIDQIPAKVTAARLFLAEMEAAHNTFNLFKDAV